MYDLIIIGGGPAGLTAAVYAARYKINQLLITRETGGTAATADTVCNFPSYDRIKGHELMARMSKQVESLEVPIEYDGVESIGKTGDHFIVKTENRKKFNAKKILYCLGTSHNKLNIPGEEEHLGRGVSYCATCDGAFYKDKTVAVVGGRDGALTSALLMSEFCTHVYIVYRRDTFSFAEPTWVELVGKEPKIRKIFNEEVARIEGDSKVKNIILKSGKELKVDGVFIEIGATPNTAMLRSLGVKLEKGYVVVDKNQRSSVHGIYAAGDVTDNEFRQIVTACGQGAVAIFNIYHALKKEKKE